MGTGGVCPDISKRSEFGTAICNRGEGDDSKSSEPSAAIALDNAFRSVTAPLTFSKKTFSAPAAISTACCASKVWPSALTPEQHDEFAPSHFFAPA
jgi:hypothetical protein